MDGGFQSVDACATVSADGLVAISAKKLPPAWNTVFRRFRRRAEAIVFKCIFNSICDAQDLEDIPADATVLGADRCAWQPGRRFARRPGQRSGITGVPDLFDELTFNPQMADKAFHRTTCAPSGIAVYHGRIAKMVAGSGLGVFVAARAVHRKAARVGAIAR